MGSAARVRWPLVARHGHSQGISVRREWGLWLGAAVGVGRAWSDVRPNAEGRGGWRVVEAVARTGGPVGRWIPGWPMAITGAGR
jgi:hypothetical protein